MRMSFAIKCKARPEILLHAHHLVLENGSFLLGSKAPVHGRRDNAGQRQGDKNFNKGESRLSPL